MGVGWLWLVDTDAGRVEILSNVRGRMVPGAAFERGQTILADPFPGVAVPLDLILI